MLSHARHGYAGSAAVWCVPHFMLSHARHGFAGSTALWCVQTARHLSTRAQSLHWPSRDSPGQSTSEGNEMTAFQCFLKLVARDFLRVLRFPPLLHRFNGSANRNKAQVNAISTLSNLIAELSLRTTCHVKRRVARDKRSMCCT